MILISIYPEQVEAILSETKKYEFRKFPYKRSTIDGTKFKYIAIYETSPTSAITTILKIGAIHFDTVVNLWEKFGKSSGVTKDYFMTYYHKKINGTALHIEKYKILLHPIKITEIKKIYPSFIPPQNYYNLEDNKYSKLKEIITKRLK